MKLRLLTIYFAAKLIMLLAACTFFGGTPASTLKDTTWVLVTLNGQTARTDTQVTLQLDQKNLSGSDGCNSYSGSYQDENGKFQVGPDLVSTMMACSEEIMQQSSAYTSALLQSVSYKISDEQLTLFDTAGSPLAVFKH